jgi:hypothetical protein
VMNALKHEGAAMCSRCGFVAGREKDGCNQITCPKPCSAAFCSKCSRDWGLCKGTCKGGATEVLERAAEEEEESSHSPLLKEDKSMGHAQIFDDEEDEDEELEDKAAKRKRAPCPDPLFERFTKKAKSEMIEDEDDEHDPEATLDVSNDEDKDAHDDDEDDEAGFDIEEDNEYGSDDGEEDGDDALGEDFEE